MVAAEDVAAVRAAAQAFDAVVDVEDFMQFTERFWHEDIEYQEDPQWPGAASYRGRDEVQRRFLEYEETLGFDWRHATFDDVVATDHAIVMSLRIRGRSIGAGVPFEQSIGYLCRVNEGRLSRLRAFLDRDQALRAAGAASG